MKSKNLGVFWHAGVVPQYLERYEPFLQYFNQVFVFVPSKWREYKEFDYNIEGVNIVPIESMFNFHQHTFVFKDLSSVLEDYLIDTAYIHEEPNSLNTFQLVRYFARKNTSIYLDSAVINHKLYFKGANIFEQYVYRNIDGVFFRNEDVRKVLLERGCPEAKILGDMGNGVSNKLFYKLDDSVSFKRVKGKFHIGFSGRINEAKGCRLLLEFMKSNENFELSLCGFVEDEEIFQNLVSLDNVSYFGFLKPKELNEFYNSLDLLILPSIGNSSWVEQFGRVIIEAICAGTPVVGSDIGMIPILVGKGNVFKSNDINSLDTVVKKFLDKAYYDCALRIQEEVVLSRYTWEALAKRFVTLTGNDFK